MTVNQILRKIGTETISRLEVGICSMIRSDWPGGLTDLVIRINLLYDMLIQMVGFRLLHFRLSAFLATFLESLVSTVDAFIRNGRMAPVFATVTENAVQLPVN